MARTVRGLLTLCAAIALTAAVMLLWQPTVSAERSADDYGTIECKGIVAPRMVGGNLMLIMNFSAPVSDRTLQDMQLRSKDQFTVLIPAGARMSAAQVDTLYDRGVITADKTSSLLYKIQFGCPEYNNSRDRATGLLLTAADTVSDIKLYEMEKIQRKAALASVQSVQIHFIQSTVQMYLKGDSSDSTHNIVPAANQKMIIRLKEGFLFPTGRMLKEDITFMYYPELNKWFDITYGEPDFVTYTDDTLSNQGGYTDREIEIMDKE